LKYDKLLDQKIVEILYEKSFNNNDSTLGYNELYREICKIYRKISKGVYDFHIKKLVNEGIIEKKRSNKKNNAVYCYLTTKAKDEKKMQLLVFKSKKEKENY
jgi:DNA-binding HxlR family transcriptional regulator